MRVATREAGPGRGGEREERHLEWPGTSRERPGAETVYSEPLEGAGGGSKQWPVVTSGQEGAEDSERHHDISEQLPRHQAGDV